MEDVSQDPVFLGLKKLLKEKFSLEEEKIRLDSSFINDLGFDSLDITEFIMAIEENFHLETIDNEETKGLSTVLDAVNLLKKFLEKKSSA